MRKHIEWRMIVIAVAEVTGEDPQSCPFSLWLQANDNV